MTKERRVKFPFLFLGSTLITSARRERMFSVIPSLDHDRRPKSKVYHQNTGFSGMLTLMSLPHRRMSVWSINQFSGLADSSFWIDASPCLQKVLGGEYTGSSGWK